MGLGVAIGALTAFNQINAGKTQAKSLQYQGDYNAKIYEQQAAMVQNQKKLLDYQYNRNAARMRGEVVAKTAGKGLMLSGSPLAVLIDNETQMQLDKNVQDYNLDIQSNYAMSGASYYRRTGLEQAKLAKATGYSNAFSTILKTAGQAAGKM